MAKYDCEICRGSGQIIVPIYPKISMHSANFADSKMSIQPSSKSYPCPECAPTAPMDRIAIVDFHGMIDTGYEKEPGFMDHARDSVAHRALAAVMKRGFIQFRTEPPDKFNLTTKLIGTMAMVAPAHVATMQQRIREHQGQIAAEVVKEAFAQIDNWGSYFGHSDISKKDANQMIADALIIVLARHTKESK